MPEKKIKLHVSSNNNSNGVLRVQVTPWRVHIDHNDTVEWELETNGPAANDILWFRVEQIDRAHAWPFEAPLPPDGRYTAVLPTKKVTSTGRNTDNSINDVVAYGLTIGFKDDSGSQRIMYIDPDMIIDS